MKCKKDCEAEVCPACARIEASIQRWVDEAPPLTSEQVARLSRLLAPPIATRVDLPLRLNVEVRS